jgi:hypothetical protein
MEGGISLPFAQEPVLSQMSPVHTLTQYFLRPKLLPSSSHLQLQIPFSFIQVLWLKVGTHVSLLHTFHISHQSHPPWLDYSNNVGWAVYTHYIFQNKYMGMQWMTDISQDSSLWMTRFNYWKGQKSFPLPSCPDQFWGPLSLLLS